MSNTTFYVDEMQFKRLHLLSGVNLESIKGLLDLCTIRTLQPEEMLIARDQSNRTVYFLLNGRLRIHLDSIDTVPHIILGPGESVGEMSVVDNRPVSAFVVADDLCTLLAMDEEILWSLVQSSHVAACNLLFTIIKRLRHTDSVISAYAEMGLPYQQYGSVDALTGLHNRYWLDNMLKRQCLRSSTSKKTLSLIIINIDNFEEFNNQHGRLYGDRVIYSVAHTISELLRPTDIITRYRGDEFIVVLPDIDIATARHIAERLHRGVIEKVPVTPDGQSIPYPTIYMGIAEIQAKQTSEMLIDAADRALFRAKNSDGNCISE